MSRAISMAVAQNAINQFNFCEEALDHYNSAEFAKKHPGVESIDSYDDLTTVPAHLAVAAKQHAASREQAHLLELLGAKYEIGIFEGLTLKKDKSNDSTSDATTTQEPTATSPSLGSEQSNTSETSTAVDSAHQIAEINNKLRKLHHKADNLINHPGQGVAVAVKKIFDRINEVTTLATSKTVPNKTLMNVQRECLQVAIKLNTHLPSLAINSAARTEFRKVITNKQKFVEKKENWKEFAAEYINIMATSGSADARVKIAMEQLAAMQNSGGPTNGIVPVTTAATNGTAPVTTAPTTGDAAPYTPNDNTNDEALQRTDSGFAESI